MRILLMGPQGCGKGTIGDLLSKEFTIPLISSGNLLRNIDPSNPKYQEVKSMMDSGKLVTQDFVSSLLFERTSQTDCQNGYILEGWARAAVDLLYFNPGFDVVLLLNIRDETTIKRLSNRRTCKKCGQVYNLLTVPPKTPGVCDLCNGELMQRSDDTEDAIKERLHIYHTETKEVLDYFKYIGNLIEINAEPLPDQVFHDVILSLQNKFSAKSVS